MSRQLPSLNALRAFEAAARHGSFSAAADELHVTHAAVSHQIKALEESLCMRLFKRLPGRVELIESTASYSTFLTKMFDQLDAKTNELKEFVDKSYLAIKVDPQFAAVWLVPRLASFADLYPDIELDVITEEGGIHPRQDEAPLAIQYVDPGVTVDVPDVSVEDLATVRAYPAGRPDILDNNPVKDTKDILNHSLLHGEDRDWWQNWFDAAGVKTKSPLPGPQFSQSYLALLAAIGGQGVALLDDIEAADALADGRLVRLSNIDVPGGQYLIIQNALMPETSVIKTVKKWLKDEMAACQNVLQNPPA